MDGCIKEEHAVGSQMVCPVCERMDDTNEFRAMVEGGGICIGEGVYVDLSREYWLYEPVPAQVPRSWKICRPGGTVQYLEDIDSHQILTLKETAKE